MMSYINETDFVIENKELVYPEIITDGLQLYYDAKGKRDTDYHRDTMLDMSGNKNHGKLQNFAYEKHSGYKDGLVFDYIDDKLVRPGLDGIDENNFTYQLNSNILAFTGGEVKTVKNGSVEVGGRNLVTNSTFKGGRNSWAIQSGNVEFIDDLMITSGSPAEVYRGNVLSGLDTVTVSVWVKGNGRFQARGGGGTRAGYTAFNHNTFKQVSSTFDDMGNGNLICMLDGDNLEVEKVKLEKGNTATDWTPAPEDLIETTELKGNTLGDMENIIDGLYKTGVLSGEEIYTDKSDDDAVVHVDVDGKSYQLKADNLYSQDKSTKGRYYGTDGSIAGSTLHHEIMEEHYPVSSGDVVIEQLWNPNGTVNGGSQNRFIFYNSNKSVLSFSNGIVLTGEHYQEKTHTTPANASFFRFGSVTGVGGVRDENIEVSVSVNYSTIPTPDHPVEINSLNDFDVVSQKSEGGLVDGIEIGGRNLFSGNGSNISDYFSIYHIEGTRSVLADESVPSGNFLRINNYTATGVSPSLYIAGFDSRLSKDMRGKTVTISMHLRGDAPFIFYNQEVKTSWTRVYRTVTFGTSNAHLYINDGGQNVVDISSLKIEEGRTATDWIPAPEDITEPDNHPLIDKINILLNEPLRSVGDTKDRLFRDSDGLWKVERNIGVSILNGSENWGEYGVSDFQVNNNVYVTTPLSNAKLGYQTSMTSHLVNKSAIWNNGNTNYYSYSDHATVQTKYFRLPLDVSISDWKVWLSQNPVTLQAQLATPVIETLSQTLQDKLNNLRSFQDSNYVYTILPDEKNTLSENIKPTLHAKFLYNNWYKEDRVINNLMIYNRALTNEEMIQNYKTIKRRWGM